MRLKIIINIQFLTYNSPSNCFNKSHVPLWFSDNLLLSYIALLLKSTHASGILTKLLHSFNDLSCISDIKLSFAFTSQLNSFLLKYSLDGFGIDWFIELFFISSSLFILFLSFICSFTFILYVCFKYYIHLYIFLFLRPK